jgi:hypothetical protein
VGERVRDVQWYTRKRVIWLTKRVVRWGGGDNAIIWSPSSPSSPSALLYSTILYSTLLYSTLLYFTHTLLYSTVLYFTHTVLYCTVLYSTLLYSTLLYSTLLPLLSFHHFPLLSFYLSPLPSLYPLPSTLHLTYMGSADSIFLLASKRAMIDEIPVLISLIVSTADPY